MFEIEPLWMLVVGGAGSFLLLLLFLVPLLRGYRHAGNVLGMLFSLLMLAFFCGNSFIGALLNRIWDNGIGHFILCVLLGTLGAAVAFTLVSIVRILLAPRKRPKKSAPAVFLAGDACEGFPERQLRRRTKVLLAYLKKFPNACVLLCGDADVQKSLATALGEQGIAPERVLRTEPSHKLVDQCETAASVLAGRELGKRVTLVTESHRLCRAVLCAKECGLDAKRRKVPVSWYLLPGFWVRESLLLLGRIL